MERAWVFRHTDTQWEWIIARGGDVRNGYAKNQSAAVADARAKLRAMGWNDPARFLPDGWPAPDGLDHVGQGAGK